MVMVNALKHWAQQGGGQDFQTTLFLSHNSKWAGSSHFVRAVLQTWLCLWQVVMQRALLEGAWEGWVDDGERGYQCGQTGKSPGKCLLLWVGK